MYVLYTNLIHGMRYGIESNALIHALFMYTGVKLLSMPIKRGPN